MTHDELLALLTATNGHSPWAHFFKKPNSVMLALRAVVELHRPYTYTNYLKQELQFCSVCEVGNPPDSHSYPCPTIQAIEKELG